MPEAHLPVGVGVGHRRDHVGRLVGHAREAARQPRRGEARAGRVAVARGGQVGLAHVDAVLGEDHRRAVQRLVDDRGDRRPAGGGHVQDVGVRRRGGRGARHPVQRLIEPRGLDEVEGRRRAGLGHALGEDLAQRTQERRPAAVRAKDAAYAGGVAPAPGPGRDDRVDVALPADEVAHQDGGQHLADAARGAARAPALGQLLGPHLDAPDLAGVLGQLEGRRPAVGGDDRQHLPVEPGQALDQQVTPRADAAHRVGVGPLRGQQDPRPDEAERHGRLAVRRSPSHSRCLRARTPPCSDGRPAAVASASSFASKATIARSISRQISSSDSRMTRPSNSSWAVSSLAPSAVGRGGRQRARPVQQPADVRPPVLGGLQAGVLLAQEHELGVDRVQRVAGSVPPVVLQRAGDPPEAPPAARRVLGAHPFTTLKVTCLCGDFAFRVLAMATSR